MDGHETILKFKDFFEKEWFPKIMNEVTTGKTSLCISFMSLAEYDPELADLLLDEPEELLKAAELAINELDLPKKADKFRIRIKGLPKSQQLLIKDKRSKNLNKFFFIEGIIRQTSEVKPQATLVRFECPSCGQVIPVLQLDKKLKHPQRCVCGRKGKFKILDQELMDVQRVIIEEPLDFIEGAAQPERMNVILKEDLTSPEIKDKHAPGSRVIITGILKSIPVMTKMGEESTERNFLLEANHLEITEMDFAQVKVESKDITQFEDIIKTTNIKGKDFMKKMFENPNQKLESPFSHLVQSIAPEIHGHNDIKEAMLFQQVGGVPIREGKEIKRLGEIHLLLIGDPGTAKSQLGLSQKRIAPKSRYVSGPGATGVGLTASVVKDEFLGGYALEAGAAVLANKGLMIVDEFDKMDPEDAHKMHEVLAQQTVTINKATIHATLKTEIGLMAIANPKYSRFDSMTPLGQQINLPSSLLNRFDLIFPIKDISDEKKDKEVICNILKLYREEKIESTYDSDFLKKYVSYCRRTFFPKTTSEAEELIVEMYVKTRSRGKETKIVPISARQGEALLRLSQASAKLRMSNKIEPLDVFIAYRQMMASLEEIAIDPETGIMEYDRIGASVVKSQRNEYQTIEHVQFQLAKTKPNKQVPIEELIEGVRKETGWEDLKIEALIEKLINSGDLFQPTRGFIQLT